MGSFDFLRREKDVRSFQAGDSIFQEGEPGDAMYAVVDGEVEIRKGGRLLETVPHGAVFGEMALIDRSARSADAVAKTDCTLAVVTQRRFTFLVQETPFFAVDIMRVLAERLRRYATD
jgi:CRP/FNR family cyclic AMP-dependent transcriptional regulator